MVGLMQSSIFLQQTDTEVMQKMKDPWKGSAIPFMHSYFGMGFRIYITVLGKYIAATFNIVNKYQ